MKKIITFIAAVLALTAAQAEEKTVWEGNEAISWNTEVAPGTQFETPEGTFAGLAEGNTIRVYTTTTYDEPQYVLTYKKGDAWEWTDLDVTVTDGVIAYTVADATTATEISERGLVVRGQAYTITKITIDSEAQPEPQPAEGEQTVWEGNEAISWNTEVAPGTQFETPEGIFAGLQKDNVIRFYTTTEYDEPQYVVTYKKGDAWEWTDLDVATANGVITYTVADETTATEISERGLVIRGQAYNLTKITVTKAGVSTIIGQSVGQTATDGKLYNLRGMEVKGQPGRGIYILNGKKIVK
ncbi:MAG: hypothetical protein IJ612_03500 [Prevotella sp.]|nr:hypothetical protein [Prevotella sp.]